MAHCGGGDGPNTFDVLTPVMAWAESATTPGRIVASAGANGTVTRVFRKYVHERLGPALRVAGARDLRTYTFLPWTRYVHPTPGVCHDNPAFRRYHASVVMGAESRDAMAGLLTSEQVAGIVADQHTVLTAVHAYTLERRVPVVASPAGEPFRR
ncbi:tannase/feruloyl esterase family alpha/beta hydrolase [Streptomyces sp. NPDC102259]|uniref:tannase/feruloyl esterase family alpha/beta hydrolase n=1 Tax=Streptomyces sp. NPDC102259 TaxID=3366148 RepID=UPI0037F47B37